MNNRCPKCNREKATVWRRQDIGKAGRNGLCFQSIAFGPEYHKEDRAFHEQAIQDCAKYVVDWRAALHKFITSDVVSNINGKFYHPRCNIGFGSIEEAVDWVVDDILGRHPENAIPFG